MEITINTDSNGRVVGTGDIKHKSVENTYAVPSDALPDDLENEFDSYIYDGKEFVKSPRPEVALLAERKWQKSELERVNAAIINYQIDISLSESHAALKASKLTSDEYVELLLYRKALTIYAETGYSPPRPSTAIVF